ncbi:MAG: hypothetical protein PVSMB4_01980 [Ktedonobacterales bacterium]
MTTKPSVATFNNELPTANWGDIWLGLLAQGIVTAIFGFIALKIVGSAFNPAANPGFSNLPPQTQAIFRQVMAQSPFAAFASIITVPIGFFIGMAILFVCAKIVGGTGTFLSQSYAFMLYSVPINVVRAVLSIVPVLGSIASILLGIYSIVLAVMAMAAGQRLTTGRAIAAILIPVVVVGLLICALIVVLVVLVGAATHPTTTP